MKKIMFAAMTALILCSIFVGIKFANTVDANGVAMNPTEKVVDPAPADQTFLYEVIINTTVTDVSAWEVKLLWNPAYLRCYGVVWGSFMTTGGVVDITNSSIISSGSEFIIFGQNYDDQKLGTTGTGTLAYINFTYVLPGQTFVKVVSASVWDDDMVETVMTCYDGRVKSNLPAPYFTWSTADGRNPLPTHNVRDGGDDLPNSDVVTFDASTSYDVGDTTWNATKNDYDLPVAPDIVALLWEYGDGASDYYVGGNLSTTTTHTYASYIFEGWTVNLTVWDSEGEFWASTWTSFPIPANTVPMWRDVGIVDIWPSVPPYQNWEVYADDWYQYWFMDSTDFWLAGSSDPYWDYELPDSLCDDYGIPYGSTVRDIGEFIYILVTANNYGSVAEKVNVNLYALGVQTKIKKVPAGTPYQIVSVEQIGSWKNKVLNAGAGSGWGLLTVWEPTYNMTYILFATIEAASDASIHDGSYGDNYFYLTNAVSNIAIWNGTSASMVPHTVTWGEYFADQNGDGKVDYVDLGYITGNNYGLKNLAPSWKNLLPKPPP